jgi:hypothetical protein
MDVMQLLEIQRESEENCGFNSKTFEKYLYHGTETSRKLAAHCMRE